MRREKELPRQAEARRGDSSSSSASSFLRKRRAREASQGDQGEEEEEKERRRTRRKGEKETGRDEEEDGEEEQDDRETTRKKEKDSPDRKKKTPFMTMKGEERKNRKRRRRTVKDETLQGEEVSDVIPRMLETATPTPSKTRLYWNAVFQDKKEDLNKKNDSGDKGRETSQGLREGEGEGDSSEKVYFIDSRRLLHLLMKSFFFSSSCSSFSSNERKHLSSSLGKKKKNFFEERERSRDRSQNLLEALVSSAVYGTLLPDLPGRFSVPPKSRIKSLIEFMCGCRHTHQVSLLSSSSSPSSSSGLFRSYIGVDISDEALRRSVCCSHDRETHEQLEYFERRNKRRFLLQDCGCIGEDLPLLKAQYCLAVCGFDDLLVRSKADISSTEAECPEAIDSVLHHAAHILNIGGSLLIVEPTRHLGDLILVLSKALLNPSSNSRLLRCDSLRLHGEKKDIVTFQFTRMSSKNYQPSHHYKALDDHLHRTSHKLSRGYLGGRGSGASTRNGILLQTALITKEGTEKERRKEEEESAEEEEGDGETPSLFDLPYLLRFAEEIEDRRSSVQFRKDISSSRSSSSSSSSACLSFREKTCLHIAAEKESIEMFYILLQHGADIDAVDSEGLRPEDQIANCIRHELASWIEKTERSRSRHDEEDREEGDGKEENSCFFPYEQKEEEAESSSSIVIDRECNIPRKKGKRRRIDALTSSSSSCGEEHEEEEETKEEDRKKLSFRQRRREEERNEAPSSSSPLYSDFPPGDILSVVTAGEDLLSRNERNLCLLSWLAGILEEEKETNFDIRRSGKKKKKSATICRDMKGRDDDYEKEENEEEEEEKSINFLEILSSDLQGPLVWPSVYPIETIDTCGRHLHITRKDEAEEERRKGLHGGDLFSHNKMPC